ncbi:MAG: metal-dependent phosphohydrolase [Oscillatoria princeps RMCB-10]|jgi:hypothetical protein|nr:metal-dependent phosphohydrolase [Oscillatoria princeps RMCB-10]
MFNATQLLIRHFANRLRTNYSLVYGRLNPNCADMIAWAGNMALEYIANSDALYHNVEHTILVTLVGQEILRSKHIREGGVSCEDWLNFTISLLCHDIGYVKGVCRQDRPLERLYATGIEEQMVLLLPETTDASLAPYHIDRAKLFIEERFGGDKIIDTQVIGRNIELTRFPMPADEASQDTVNYAGLVRAADFIGQLSDPRYFKKISALFYEFAETGINKTLGYRNPGDMWEKYPKFYWEAAYPYIQNALTYLEVTQEGKQILANLYENVFRMNHENKRSLQVMGAAL